MKLWGRRILVGRGNRDPENRGVAGEIQIAAIQGMTLEGLTEAERWADAQSGVEKDALWKTLEKRRERLKEDQASANEYDKDD